jgi:tetratricopeptide (TPR) repeat protein
VASRGNEKSAENPKPSEADQQRALELSKKAIKESHPYKSEGIKLISEAIRLDPTKPEFYEIRAGMYWNLDDWDGGEKKYDYAIKDFTTLLHLEPSKSQAWYFRRGGSYYWKDDYDKAISDYNTAIAIDPKHSHSYRQRGACYLKKNDYDRAIEDLNEAIKLDPKCRHSHEYRAQAYRAQGNYALAELDEAKVLTLRRLE